MDGQAKHGGVWKDVPTAYANRDSDWHGIRRIFSKSSGEWAKVWETASLRKSKGMIRFRKQSRAAVVVDGTNNKKTTWYGTSVLNTGVVEYKGKVWLYFRALVGTDDNDHAVGCWSQDAATFDPMAEWTEESSYILHNTDVSGVTWAGATKRLTNVEACVFNNEIYLWAILKGVAGTGTGWDANAPTMLFKSSDGVNFTQVGLLTDDAGATTIHTGGLGVVHNGTNFLMVHSAQDDDLIGYRRVVRTSSDGQNWSAIYDGAFPAPDTIPDKDFDDESWGTTRMVVQGDQIYAFHAGGGDHADYPEGIGLYRCDTFLADSQPWTEYAYNPVMMRGDGGSIDSGALWSPSVIELRGQLHMFYEAAGAYAYAPGSTEADLARDTAYGGYDVSNYSSICHAVCDDVSLDDIWAVSPIEVGETYTIRNMLTGSWLRSVGIVDGSSAQTDLDPAETLMSWVAGRDNEFFVFKCATALTKVLEVEALSTDDGALARVWEQGVGDNRQQEWHLVARASADGVGGIFYVQNRNSGLFLTANEASTVYSDTLDCKQRKFDGGLRQQWLILKQ